jgi:hypothetical protein
MARAYRAEASESRLCYWCREPLPRLPEDASYVDEINHYIHDACRDERDDNNRRMEQLRAGIVVLAPLHVLKISPLSSVAFAKK